jgi:hypothetical protein
VNELFVSGEAQTVEDAFDEILHRLDIVVGGLLDRLDLGRIVHAESLKSSTQAVEHRGFDIRQLRQGQPAQGNEVFDFHPDPVADQGALAEIVGQGGGGPPVAAVHRGNGGQ